MSIKQKLIIDKELTNNIQIIVRDETGLYNPSNDTGYGGNNGNPPSIFDKYIFDLVNLYTNTKYRQVQSDDIDNDNEYHNPSLVRIANKENIFIDANNFDLLKFEDGLYRIFMYIQMKTNYQGEGIINTDIIFNVPGASSIFDNYDAVKIGDEIYIINSVIDSTLILDRPIVSSFNSFNPVIKTSIDYIVSNNLNDCINSSIAKLCNNNSSKNIDSINILSEVQLYYWGIYRCIENNDIPQAYEYFKVAKDLCNSLNCNCND